jgi:hypothetical protein
MGYTAGSAIGGGYEDFSAVVVETFSWSGTVAILV